MWQPQTLVAPAQGSMGILPEQRARTWTSLWPPPKISASAGQMFLKQGHSQHWHMAYHHTAVPIKTFLHYCNRC